jgi:hypothetical protein
MTRPSPDETISAMWIAHHYPEDYDRCLRLGRTHICRRCAVLYPLAFATLLAARAGLRWPHPLDPWLVVALPLPAVIEFVGEHLGAWRYQPVRQVVVTVPLALALGVGFDRYLDHPGDLWFWGVVVGYGGVCLAAALLGHRVRR